MNSTGVLALLATLSVGADPNTERVVGALSDHFAAMNSVRVRGVDRLLKSGGLAEADPATAAVVHDDSRGKDEYEIWFAPPKRRLVRTETRLGPRGNWETRTVRNSFDGQTYASVWPTERKALVVPGGSLISFLRDTPVQAIGLCYTGTHQTKLDALLSDRSKVSVKPDRGPDGQAQWLLEVKSLPNDVTPHDTTPEIRQNTLVRVWLTLEPEVIVRAWGGYSKGWGNKGAETQMFGIPPPRFAVDGYVLIEAYINCDHQASRDEARNRTIMLPRRIIHGNGLGSYEFRVQELVLNPREAADSFRLAIPAGYAISQPGEKGEAQVEVAGGRTGEAIRIQEISQGAHAILASGDSLRAPSGMSWTWVIAIGCLALGVGAAGGIYWRKWRTA